MRLDKVIEFAEIHPTPFFLFDLSKLKENYFRVQRAFSNATIHYAMKANSHPLLVSTLRRCGSCFEVGSWEEIALLIELGIPPREIIFSSPVKLPRHISLAYSVGVNTFVYDSLEELRKISKLAPGARVLARIRVSNNGCVFPLNNKFGASLEETVDLLYEAQSSGLIPYGIAFHVGSQCELADAWAKALNDTLSVWVSASDLPLSCLDIGGGFPVAYDKDVVSIEDIAMTVNEQFLLFPEETELRLEPGRYIAADTGVLVSTIIGKACREGTEWLYLDVGALHGLFESFQSGFEISYRIDLLSDKISSTIRKYVLSGPTCDPDDTILREVALPEPKVGDKIVFYTVGAYSMVYATNFNGFPHPEAYFYFSEKGDEHDFQQECVGAGRSTETS
jgi:ornithine decarboxylase